MVLAVAHYATDHDRCRGKADEQQLLRTGMGCKRIGEQHNAETCDGIDAELDHDAGKEHAHRCGRYGVRIRQPHVKRHDRRFGEEATGEQRVGKDHHGIVPRSQGQPDLRHIQCTRNGVEQGDAGQHQECCDGVCHGKVERSLQGCGLGRFEAAQRKGSGAHQFEKNEQVEQVSGEREAAHGSKKDEQQRLHVVRAGIDAPPGKDECQQCKKGGKRGKPNADGLGDQSDAKRHGTARIPVTQPVGDGVALNGAQQ